MPPKQKPTAPQTLDDVLALVQGKHGGESIMLLGQTPMAPVEVIPTGSFALDEALGVGGFPRGRITEIYGPESTGKTSVALHAIASAQHMGLNAAFIDAEHAFNEDWARALGVDIDNLLVSQPDHGEQALDIAETLCTSGLVGIIVIDSVAALTPKAEIEGMMGDSHMGLHARLMSQALRKLAGTASRSKTAIVFINQLREKIGVVWGNPETTTGGKALKFYASVRIDVRRSEPIKEGTVQVGHKIKVTVVKNKVARPFKQVIVDFFYSCGISAIAELLELAVIRGVVSKSGSWYIYNGENIGNGSMAARKRVEEDPALRAEIEEKTREAAGTVVEVPKLTSLGLDGPDPWDNPDV